MRAYPLCFHCRSDRLSAGPYKLLRRPTRSSGLLRNMVERMCHRYRWQIGRSQRWPPREMAPQDRIARTEGTTGRIWLQVLAARARPILMRSSLMTHNVVLYGQCRRKRQRSLCVCHRSGSGSPTNPAGLELPYFSFVQQIRPGGSAVLDEMLVGCAVKSWKLSIKTIGPAWD